MKRLPIIPTILAACSVVAFHVCSSPIASTSTVEAQDTACISSDVVLHNGVIYTANAHQWQADVVAVKDGRIAFVGSATDAEPWLCGATETIDLKGSTVFPGFTDAHQHLEGVGKRTRTLSLFGIATLQETVEKIKAFAANVPSNQWVLGRGWIEREWQDEQRFLTAADLDPFTENKPLFMPRADGVSAVVNSKALALAGVTKDTPDPEGGKFERYPDGTPTGYILATAMDPFRAILPKESDEYIQENLRRGMQVNVSRGWTHTHDAGMLIREVEQLRILAQHNEMLHRVYIAVPIDEAKHLFDQGAQKTADGMFNLNAIKVFIDGTLGSRGAALLAPYSDADHSGFMNRTTKAELMPVLDNALRNGYQVMTHVIGDRALKTTLDWYEESWNALPKTQWKTQDLRWRLEHAQIIPPQEQVRMAKLGIVASMQPSHAIGDLNFAPDRLGEARLAYAYPWKPLIENGIKVVAGSDAPVEVGDPRIEFYAAISRSRLDGSQGKGWHPEYAVSRDDALRMFTLWPAYASFQEADYGSIEVGKYADFSIFDTDFMTAAPADILKAETVMTIVGGKKVYVRQ